MLAKVNVSSEMKLIMGYQRGRKWGGGGEGRGGTCPNITFNKGAVSPHNFRNVDSQSVFSNFCDKRHEL